MKIVQSCLLKEWILVATVSLRPTIFLFCFKTISNHAFYITHIFAFEVSLHYWLLWPTVRRDACITGGRKVGQTLQNVVGACILLLQPAFSTQSKYPVSLLICTFRCDFDGGRKVVLETPTWQNHFAQTRKKNPILQNRSFPTWKKSEAPSKSYLMVQIERLSATRKQV